MIQLQQSKYNYTKLISLAEDNAHKTSFKKFMKEKLKECRENHYDGEARKFNRQKIADLIGIELSTLTKILNGTQITKKRDIIIAICLVLRLNKADTNLALSLYPMATLNIYNSRDLVIIQAIYDEVSLPEDLNEILVNHGFEKLNILRSDTRENVPILWVPNDIFTEVSVSVSPYCVAEDDAKISLHERYKPSMFDYHSEMVIQRKIKADKKYRVSRDTDGYYDIELQDGENWKYLYSSNELTQKYFNVKECYEPALLNEIAKLKEYTDRKAVYVYNMCNDTRNYISRFDALNNNGQLVVYGETFGFDAPELSEYFQLEVSNTGYLFSVSYTSIFLEKYLGQERYKELYGDKASSVIDTFTSLDEINNKQWCKYFRQLLNSAKDLIEKLQARELFMFNARAFMEIEDLAKCFQVEDAFEYSPQEDSLSETMILKEPIIGSDNKEITIDDLYQAAELDICSIEELCSIRQKYGSLKGFLQLNTLTGHENQLS